MNDLPPATTTSLVELFAGTVREHPDAPAVSDDDRRYTYQELDAHADALARRLIAGGVGPEDRVGLHLRRGVDVVVAILGILKAGAAYLPVDTRYPAARRDHMLLDGDVRVVLTEPGRGERLAHLDRTVLEWRSGDGPAGPAPVVDIRPEQAACVLYTSGSTGRPKGTVLEHRQLVAFAADPALPALSTDDRTAQCASISFDTITFEVWRSLAGGAEIVVLPAIPDLLGSDLRRELRRRGITAMLAPAVAVNHVVRFDRDAFAGLRLLCSGGDVLLPATCRGLLSGEFGGRLFNLYGPTETTVACTGHEVARPPRDGAGVPIGGPLGGRRLYVLDPDLRPVAAGETGELYVGGAGVGRGYLGRPGRTAERFVPDVFAGDGSRMYATGDLVRDVGGGVLRYVGRIDSQLKISGYRVEPGEVEAALCRFPAVGEAAVTAVGATGERRLVAFLIRAGDRLSIRELRDFLAGEVLEHLVPSEFVVLDRMPTDPHGKRDWAELSRVADDRERLRDDYLEPRDDIERYLTRLWEDLLSVERVGARDDFFTLGGHSLLAVRARRIIQRDLGVPLAPEALFQCSVVADLADHIRPAKETVAS
ncbi:non-ribosomal peptide synthetase [Dactylosporangium roseum]|uniref:Non-ribosomal peptide synthetase n=1 Tax=Dactylosporangium roseum TaxID=47989 RepID=A0ABY5ZAM9_9ACTN|nr:non-ribosomal peptide synthetase [Dactylosporangium roseum]UWZ39128.1 non-ribosomal peptide synthetase [Dactylosporangium roseum]